MIFLNVFLILLYTAAFVFCWSKDRKRPEGIPVWLGPFYRISIRACTYAGKKGRTGNRSLVASIYMLNPLQQKEALVKEFYYKKWAYVLLIVFAGNLAAFGTGLSGLLSQKEGEGIIVLRPDYRETKKEEYFKVILGDEELKVKLELEPREYTEEQAQAYTAEAAQQLDQLILAENLSADLVNKNLYMPRQLEGLPVEITWETDAYHLVGSSGQVDSAGADEEGTPVQLKAVLACGSTKTDYQYDIRVVPPDYEMPELLLLQLEQQLKQQEQATREEAEFYLPQTFLGQEISWHRERVQAGGILLILTGLGAFLICREEDQKITKELEKRERQMMLDYPGIVSKLSLFIDAGMTIPGAWDKITGFYKLKLRDKGIRRYAYDEMLLSGYELKSGVPAGRVYAGFGRRCRSQQYLKLGSLLDQHLKRGTGQLRSILKAEATEAFEMRKAMAKQLGEEAGTKLLVPMLLMLVVVLVILIIPAYLSIQF